MDSEKLESTFKHFISEFNCKEDAQLLLQSNVFPYDYLDSDERFKETHLPIIESFYSSIKNEGISQDDYEHAKRVFEHLKLQNLGEWTDVF